MSAELSVVHGTLHRNKKFLYVKIERWNLQHLFDFSFHEPLQNFTSVSQTFRKLFFMGNIIWNELKFCRISPNYKSKRCWKFQQKSFIPHKDIKNVPWIALFSAYRWHLEVLTFLIKGFDQNTHQFYYNFGKIYLFEHSDTKLDTTKQWIYMIQRFLGSKN